MKDIKDITKMTTSELLQALISNPDFATEIDNAKKWGSFSLMDWSKLLRERPRFNDNFKKHWKITTRDHCDIINAQRLKSFIGSLNQSGDYSHLLRMSPELWGFFPQIAARKIIADPTYATKCKCWEFFKPNDWVQILKKHPQFINKFYDYNKVPLAKKSWDKILKAQPQLAPHCPRTWVDEMITNPSKVNDSYCWYALNVDDWIRLLKSCPKLGKNCENWTQFVPYNWIKLLKVQPIFAEHCAIAYQFSRKEWVELLKAQPKFAKFCQHWKETKLDPTTPFVFEDTSEFRDEELLQIMKVRPELWIYSHKLAIKRICQNPKEAKKCICWEAFTVDDWFELLNAQPKFLQKCPDEMYKKFTPEMVDKLTIYNPNPKSRKIFMSKFLAQRL